MTGAPRSSAKARRQVFRDVDQRADQAEFVLARPGDRRERADAPGKHGVAEKRFAKIVGGVAERDDVRAQISRHFIDRAPAKPAADIATVAGLFRQKVQGRVVLDIGPIETAAAQEAAHRLR